nr:hypothetical protein [Xanthomonas arboricola]
MVIAGVPLRRVQILAGHADYATTEKYLRAPDAGGWRWSCQEVTVPGVTTVTNDCG